MPEERDAKSHDQIDKHPDKYLPGTIIHFAKNSF
jgi:hypothetical protein